MDDRDHERHAADEPLQSRRRLERLRDADLRRRTSSTGTLGDGARLDLASRTWSALPATGQPSPRRQLPAVWTGDSMLLWGGSTIVDGSTLPTDAFRFQTYAP